MNHSIKQFLLVYITLAVLVIYALISLAAYWVSKSELDELYDANLQQVARTIASQHLTMHDISYPNNQIGTDENIEGEESFYVRVFGNDGALLYISHPQAKVPIPSVLGFSTQKYKNKKWRFYVIKANNQTIQVAQSLKLRKVTIKETALSLMVSQLLFIPVLVTLIFFAIKKALSPLALLSSEIQHRESTNLKPFTENEVPVEIKPLVQSLNVFMDKVAFMVGVLKRFTSDAAHELRSPITALKLQLTVIEQAKSKVELDTAIQNLKNGIDRSEQLVSQLLTLARIDPNNQTRSIQSIDMLSLIKECIEYMLPLAYAKSIDLGLNTSIEHTIVGVRHEIKILINNIVDNAIRYTPNHGKIDISLFSQMQNIVLEVNDSGPGILSNDFERVFERFYRGENNNTSGSGLGLSIVKEIVNQHQAKIEILNLNPGLSFKVYFIQK